MFGASVQQLPIEGLATMLLVCDSVGKPEDGTVRVCHAASCSSPPRDLLFSLAIAETSGIESRSPPLNMALSQASGNDESSYHDKS